MKFLLIVALSLVYYSTTCIVSAGCPNTQQGIVKWSQWSARPLTSNQNVTVPAGQWILLDVTPPPILFLNIYGNLAFAPAINLELTANFIYVRGGGHLWVGSEACPITAKNVTITLVGTYDPSLNPDKAGSKVLAVFADGMLDIHGAPRTPTWTVLSNSAAIGDTQITLAQNVDWKIGESIVLANTDYNQNEAESPGWGQGTQAEVVTITSKPQANVVNISRPLKYPHYGKIWQSPDGNSIDMRGEVGLLTRNILIRGDINPATSGNSSEMHWGGHVIMRDGGAARIEYAEFINGGQKDLIGRYPVHFHYTGVRDDSYVRGNSIHDTFQRCVTVHGTHHVRVQNNVAYNSYGHCYFLEDGVEEGNIFEHNLGVHTKRHTMIKSDENPAMFWITNPNNHFYGNAAAGGHVGFWYAISRHPWGLDKNDVYNWLNLKPMGDFINNKAHSSSFGLLVDNAVVDESGTPGFETPYTPINYTASLNLNPSLNDTNRMSDAYGYPVYAYFRNFTAYKCTIRGIWTLGSSMFVDNAKLADNFVGFELVGATSMIANSLVVGETDNVGHYASENVLFSYVVQEGRSRYHPLALADPVWGMSAYDAGGGLTLYKVTFVNFNDYTFASGVVRRSGAFTTSDGPNVPEPNSQFWQIKFINVQNRFFFWTKYLTDNSVKASVYRDIDGSLTSGLVGGGCGAKIVSSFSPVLRTSSCTLQPGWNAYICPNNAPAHRQLNLWGNADMATKDIYTVTRLPDGASVNLTFSFFRQITSLPVNQEYFITYGTANQVLASGSFDLGLLPGEWIRFAMPFPNVQVTVTSGWSTLSSVTSKAQLTAANYFYDSVANLIWFHVQGSGKTFDYYNGIPYVRPGGTGVSWTGTCGGPLCSLGRSVAAPTGSPAPTTPNQDDCEVGGGPAKGIPTYTVKSNASYVIFEGTLAKPYVFDSNCKNTSVVTYNNLPTIVCTYSYTFYGWSFSQDFWNRNAKPIFPFTHLQFIIRAAPGIGEIDMTLSLSTCEYPSQRIGSMVTLSNPFYTSDGRSISDLKWTTVNIPISDIATVDNFCYIYMNTKNDRPVQFYIASIKWVDLTQTITPIANYPALPVPQMVGPGTQFVYQI